MSKRPDEIESKICGIDEAKVLDSINELGGVLEYKDRVLSSIRMINKNGEKIRIRCHGNHVISEIKGKGKKNGSSKQRPEDIDGVFCSLEKGVEFYRNKGYEIIRKDVKTRTRCILLFRGEEVKVEIDKYSDLNGLKIPPLLEIEATSEQVIRRVAKLLGFDDKYLCDWGTTDLFAYYMTKYEISIVSWLHGYPDLLKDKNVRFFIFLTFLNIINRAKESKLSLIDLFKGPNILSNPEFKPIIKFILWKTLNDSKKELDKKNKEEEKSKKVKSKKKKS